MKQVLVFAIGVTGLALLTRCGSDAATSLSGAFPNGFAVASPTATSSSRGTSARASSITSSGTRAAKVAVLSSMLSATSLAGCAVELNLQAAGNAACYGPTATYANHSDGGGGGGTFPGGDLGIWEAAEASGEACAAAQMNGKLKGSASYADAGLFSAAAMLCAAGVSGTALPAAGSSISVASSMAGLIKIGGTALSVTTATLARETDTTEGYPVYVATLVGTISTTTYTVRMKHIPTDASNSTYKGKVSVSIGSNDGTKPTNCSTSTATGHTIGTSVEYQRSSSTSESFLAKDAQFCGYDADPFVSSTNYTVDFDKELTGGQPKGWANNASRLAATINPTDNTGNYSYTWQAGYSDDSIRALSLNVTASASATTATAFFGFGPTLSSTNNGSITKMVCNWTGPGSSHTGQTKAQKQVMTRSSASSVFTPTTSNITYDPNNACESGNAAFTVQWTNVSSTVTTRGANTTTMDLVDTSTIAASYTTPTAPATVE